MPETQDNLKTLHANLIKEGYDLPDIDTFRSDMSDAVKSKSLHDNLIKEGYELPDYDTFLGDMGLKKKESSQVSGESAETSSQEQSPYKLETPILIVQTPTARPVNNPLVVSLNSAITGELETDQGATSVTSKTSPPE